MLTPIALAASAVMSAMSPVSDEPRGFGRSDDDGIDSGSTARRCPQLDAAPARDSSLRRPSMSQVFRNLFVLASSQGLPVRHSTRTADGTTGGHSSSLVRTAISALARDEPSARYD